MASGQGALGESPELLVPAFEAGVDYVVCDSLAESTTSTLALDRQRDEALGYAPDLAARLAIALPYVVERGTRLITNAGGVNPVAAHQLAVAAGSERRVPRPADRAGVRRDGAAARRAGPRGLPRRGGCGASAGGRRRRRHHRSGRRRGAVPRADRGRARMVVGRLGPAGGGCRRRPPARVLEPGRRRELLG